MKRFTLEKKTFPVLKSYTRGENVAGFMVIIILFFMISDQVQVFIFGTTHHKFNSPLFMKFGYINFIEQCILYIYIGTRCALLRYYKDA